MASDTETNTVDQVPPVTDTQPGLNDSPVGNLTGLPLVQSPLPLEHHDGCSCVRDLQSSLRNILQAIKDEEIVHAYHVGNRTCLQSMRDSWAQRMSLRHLSNAEHRIFRREVWRLNELLEDANEDVGASQARLRAKLQEREQILQRLDAAEAHRLHNDGK